MKKNDTFYTVAPWNNGLIIKCYYDKPHTPYADTSFHFHWTRKDNPYYMPFLSSGELVSERLSEETFSSVCHVKNAYSCPNDIDQKTIDFDKAMFLKAMKAQKKAIEKQYTLPTDYNVYLSIFKRLDI